MFMSDGFGDVVDDDETAGIRLRLLRVEYVSRQFINQIGGIRVMELEGESLRPAPHCICLHNTVIAIDLRIWHRAAVAPDNVFRRSVELVGGNLALG